MFLLGSLTVKVSENKQSRGSNTDGGTNQTLHALWNSRQLIRSHCVQLHALTDPPCCVGGQSEASGRVKFLHGAVQCNSALRIMSVGGSCATRTGIRFEGMGKETKKWRRGPTSSSICPDEVIKSCAYCVFTHALTSCTRSETGAPLPCLLYTSPSPRD